MNKEPLLLQAISASEQADAQVLITGQLASAERQAEDLKTSACKDATHVRVKARQEVDLMKASAEADCQRLIDSTHKQLSDEKAQLAQAKLAWDEEQREAQLLLEAEQLAQDGMLASLEALESSYESPAKGSEHSPRRAAQRMQASIKQQALDAAYKDAEQSEEAALQQLEAANRENSELQMELAELKVCLLLQSNSSLFFCFVSQAAVWCLVCCLV